MRTVAIKAGLVDLNGQSIDHYEDSPSALLFARLVNIARPVTFSSEYLGEQF